MPGTNLTRDEAATRAALLDITSYTIDLDLTTGPQPDQGTFGSVTTLEFTCRAARGLDLRRPGRADGPRDHPQRPEPRPRHGLRRQPDRARRAGGDQHARRHRRLRLLPHRRGPAPLRGPGRRPRLPLQPVRGARRPARVHDLRAARPQVGLHVQRHRPVPLGRRVQLRDPRSPRGERRRLGVELPHDQAHVDLHHRRRGRRVPRRVRHLRGQVRHHPARPLLPPVAQGAHGHRGAGQADQAELRVLRGAVRLPLPVREVRPALRPRIQHGRHGERRLRHAARRVPPAQPPAPLLLRVPHLRHHPRDGAHVVRQPRHHALVGRPVAQRVVRRVGLLLVRGQRHRLHRRLDRLRERAQADRLPRRPAALDPPDRGRQRRPARGRGQLRHDHLRQGRLGAQAARRVGGHGALPRRPARLLQGVGVREPRVQGPPRGTREVVGPRAPGLGPGVAPDRRRQHPRTGVRARLRRQLHVVHRRAVGPPGLADAAPPPPRHRPVRRRGRAPGPS